MSGCLDVAKTLKCHDSDVQPNLGAVVLATLTMRGVLTYMAQVRKGGFREVEWCAQAHTLSWGTILELGLT